MTQQITKHQLIGFLNESNYGQNHHDHYEMCTTTSIDIDKTYASTTLLTNTHKNI